MINVLNNIKIDEVLFKKDINEREINLYKIIDTQLCGLDLYYPNVLLFNNKKYYIPIEEKIMSLKNVKQNDIGNITPEKILFFENNPVFFFIYNTDNYYHFVYDTLPYLISYFIKKKEINNLKLLMNLPNKKQKQFYKFVSEFLEILGVDKSDIVLADKNTLYKTIYISSSYTHGINSNLPPRSEIYNFYNKIVNIVLKNNSSDLELPEKIYVSRRTWINRDFSNIGTNYTTRRKLENEDELVNQLIQIGFKEIFSESLSTFGKILLFANAKQVVGAIGGGLVNVLFCNKNCKVISINSPTFLNINERFKYSFDTVKIHHFNDTKHVDQCEFKKYMRIQYKNIVGEIIEICDNDLLIKYNDTPIAGWNNEVDYKTLKVKKSDCIKLDNGLNSPWLVDTEKLINILK